jgi:hypothetical protein
MNSTEKADMQVEESQDGGAIVALPEGEISPQHEEVQEESVQASENSQEDGEPTTQAEQETDADEEELRQVRREERRLKRKMHQSKAKESVHLISALKKQNQELAERLAAVEKKTSGAELARIDKAIEDSGVQVEYAKMKMREAVGQSDGDGVAKAEEMLYEARRKLESLQSIKNNATKQINQQKPNIQVPDPQVQRLAADWMEDNPWYDPNGRNEESQIAQMIDKRLTDEGFDPTTEDYWEELDGRLKKYLPEKYNMSYNKPNNSTQRPRSVMTSSGRETTATTKANEFRLSPDRVAAIKEAGAWDNPEARKRMISKFAEWDRQNKNRG